MNISQQQIINPGIYEYDENYKKQLSRFERAVERARFLSEKEKNHWYAMAYVLNKAQLLEAERLIISEDLRMMHTRQQLEKIKPLPQK